MERSQAKNGIGLLPKYFKLVGILVVFVTIATIVTIRLVNIELIKSHSNISRVLTMNGVILGLLLITCSRDKTEDELTLQIRMRSMAGAFVFSVISVIITPLVKLLANDPDIEMTAQSLVFSMLLFYLMIYYLQKRGR